ncbi:hypothetical protein AAAA14_20690, partial [Providencia stuartii]|uniref:hypothetical protein n=1 Tax=Providencia stuartii TaxID=588 RepID=UPI0030F14CB5
KKKGQKTRNPRPVCLCEHFRRKKKSDLFLNNQVEVLNFSLRSKSAKVKTKGNEFPYPFAHRSPRRARLATHL